MREVLFSLLRLSGLPYLFRGLVQRNRITILLYHDIKKEAAKKNFSYLKKKYNIIGLDHFIDAIEKEIELPKKAMIITFDDGHIGNYKLLPVIKEHHIPVTIFLCASIINTNRHFWFTENGPFSDSELKEMADEERIKNLTDFGFDQEKEYEKPQALKKTQLEEMRPFVNFQSHTLFHPILTKCDDVKAETEISKSKNILEKEFSLNVNAIAYPNGNYSEREIQLSRRAGYKCGVTVDYGFNTIRTDPFRLKRLSVNDTDDLNELIVKASGVWAFFKTKIIRLKNIFKK